MTTMTRPTLNRLGRQFSPKYTNGTCAFSGQRLQAWRKITMVEIDGAKAAPVIWDVYCDVAGTMADDDGNGPGTGVYSTARAVPHDRLDLDEIVAMVRHGERIRIKLKSRVTGVTMVGDKFRMGGCLKSEKQFKNAIKKALWVWVK